MTSELIESACLAKEKYVGLVKCADNHYTVRLYGDAECLWGLVSDGVRFSDLEDAWEFFHEYVYQERGSVVR